MSVLLLLAHPGTPPSRVNAALADAARTVPGVTVHDLYDAYPHFFVDARREQAGVEAHAAVVFQHPLYWYAAPPLLKQWWDTVLEEGWAYGRGATATVGKTWAHAISTAGSERSYATAVDPSDDPDGRANVFPLADYLKPWRQSARLCGMRWRAPFVVHDAERIDATALDAVGARYRDWLAALAAEAGREAGREAERDAAAPADAPTPPVR
jgi:glutathione-regulated potassium-efflux system ancillary protein KefG